MKPSSLVLVVGLALAPGCGGKTEAPLTPTPADPSSYANVDAFVVRHLVLDLTANFDNQTLAGTAELQLERRNPAATELILDTRDLSILNAEAAIGTGAWVATAFRLDEATPAFGSALRITMPPGADRARITYASSPNARGLQWLSP
jgi:aminopeptidase N